MLDCCNNMNTKEFIQLFIPPIYYKIKHRLCPPKVRVRHPLPMYDGACERMIVIGNGPSLNKSVELYYDIIKQSECLMVNHSASTDMYEFIQPKFYLLVDPLWVNPENSKHKDAIYALIDAIVTKTSWSMTIVMPYCAQKGCYAVEQFRKNTNLNVLFFEDGHNMPKDMTQVEAWDKNLVCPPGQTVLNTAVWLSVYWGYNETYLVGADSSWHEELKMDQETNHLYTIDSHFYKNSNNPVDDYDAGKDRRTVHSTLHEELYSTARALEEYWELQKYADWKGVKVYNASEYSWIDAFERKKLK